LKFNLSSVVNLSVFATSFKISFANFLFNSISSLTFIASNFSINSTLHLLNSEFSESLLPTSVVTQLQLQVIELGNKFFNALYAIFFSDLSS
jgi:hypothetical protein